MRTLIIIGLLFITPTLCAQDMIRVIYGKTTTKWYPLPEKGMVLDIPRKSFVRVTSVIIDIKQESPSPAYKRKIEVTQASGKSLYSVNESKRAGRYNVNLTTLRRSLSKQKLLLVYLQQSPVNDMMGMPARQTLLAKLNLR